ncbi:MAG: M15 family metallopeptidase [Rubrivivax sp.]
MVNRDLSRLAPAFAKAVQDAIAECNAPSNALDAMVYEGYRSEALQAMYYRRGRTVKPPFKTVTNAPGNLYSWHGFGLAVDVVHRTKYWLPPEGDGWFRKVGSIFKRHASNWGGDWAMADLPHFQWVRCPPGPSDVARQLIDSQGMQAVWQHVGAIDGRPVQAALPALMPMPSPARTPSSRTIGTIDDKHFSCTIFEDPDGRVHFTADADIDADGANGQSGGPPAYKVDDSGSEALVNGGMRIEAGKVVCGKPWARDIVILGADQQPRVFSGGLIASMTWYRHPGKAADDPAAYVDAETVPYIVVPPLVVKGTKGIVRGCKARVTWRSRSVDCVVADRGPADSIGELSIAAARAIGLPASPRNGGTKAVEVLYELWPNVAAPGFTLQRA